MKGILSMLALLALSVAILATPGTAQTARAATMRNVGSGIDKGDCTSSPCQSIAYALGQSASGDTINIAAGTYFESLFITKSITLMGANGAVLDAKGKNNGILINGAGSAGAVVKGLTIKGADMEGILAQQTSSIQILNNTISGNDLGANAKNPVGECAPSGNVPGDCGEGVHLLSVVNALVDGNTISGNQGGILISDENGPSSRNTISNNTVTNNTPDCGITLASHMLNIGGPVPASKGGVFQNRIINNTVTSNGEAGVGIFAAPPGAANYANTVSGNTISGNGFPGVTMHSHAPFQNLNDNVIVNNTMTGGMDEDSGVKDTVGIMVFADIASRANPVSSITIQNNTISKAKYGVYFSGTTKVFDVASNSFADSVANKVGSSTVGPAAGGPPAGGAPASGAPASSASSAPAITPPSTGDAGLLID